MAARSSKQQKAAATHTSESRAAAPAQAATTLSENGAARTSEQGAPRNQQPSQRLQPTKEVVPNPQEAAMAQQSQRPSSQASTRREQARRAEVTAEAGELQKVYAAAEQMLRDGMEFDRVAAQTKLPVEGVKMLSQMIEVDRTNDSASENSSATTRSGDPRLGALGATRRQTNV